MISEPQKSKHIPEIEGLRGLSILIVVLFHLNETLLPGGFLGVDVFFVISGYLITTFIKQAVETGTFSYANFYVRRVRRLAPAMLATLLLSIVGGSLVLSPSMMEDFSLSALAALFSFSNVYFWYQVDYFDIASHLKPMLHTWSLGVEEQFYLVWPFALVALILPLGNRAGLVLMAGIAVSLVVLTAVPIAPETLFYLLPFRLFEFFIGAFPVLYAAKQGSLIQNVTAKVHSSVVVKDVIVLIACGGIIASALLFDGDTPHPSALTLIPCVAAILLITCAPTARLGALFSNRFMVCLGSVSYSLYLIHWPLIIFYRHYAFGPAEQLLPLSVGEQVVLGLVSLALAGLMYRFVESPFRRRSFTVFTVPNKQLLSAMAAGAAVVVVLAGSAGTLGGWAWRIPEERASSIARAEAMVIADERNAYLAQNCIWTQPNVPGMQRLCLFGDTSVLGNVVKGQTIATNDIPPLDYLVIGDSHAKAAFHGLDKRFKAMGKSAVLLMPLGRQPFAGVQQINQGPQRPATEVIYPFIATLEYETVILLARWSLYFNSGESKWAEGVDVNPIVNLDGKRVVQNVKPGQSREVLIHGLDQTVNFFRGRGAKVIVGGEVPYLGTLSVECINVPSVLISTANLNTRCSGMPYADVEKWLSPAHSAFKETAEQFGFEYIPLLNLMCPDSKCTRLVGGQIIYLDSDHLNEVGASYMVETFFKPYLN